MPRSQVNVQQAPYSGNVSVDSAPPFLPLEESMARSDTEASLENVNARHSADGVEFDDEPVTKGHVKKAVRMQSRIPKLSTKSVVVLILGMFFFTIFYEAFFVDPEDRLLQPDFSDKFLLWVESHPGWGLGAISLVIAAAVITMVPIGTPLVLGCGYIYRGVYGWKLGLFVATVVSMAGSCLGAVICFLLGRYLMRETVQTWVRKYPLFDAIDVAASKQGLKIMAMLYLTPVLPLGLVSYMCGTTSMKISSFTLAKFASTPLYLIYTFIGASAHSIIKRGGGADGNESGMSAEAEAKQLEENEYLIVSGILLSGVMMTLITRHIKKELMKILDQQKKEKTVQSQDDGNGGNVDDGDDTAVELGLTTRRRGNKTDYAE
eukprot:CAMPEP_0116996848 /NCGR_PEP_ID=MMETSP0472-20121206/509_1 /TAXON_ID=693140 ORGANISM="Tiarina fusus, Strain LIS" /NCGR_SAMPLE_ID=MMETSP0472 /ASSEMBLY_ACC=CAM_ASM_000603 /LENGTH=376 /DNA_ID=CAMNT_0004695589 /DNA_START=193 /DNA_END=1323 /DNA_ORIENTATION=-